MNVSIYFGAEYWATVFVQNNQLMVKGPNAEAASNLVASLLWVESFANLTPELFLSTLPDRLRGRVYALVDGEDFTDEDRSTG